MSSMRETIGQRSQWWGDESNRYPTVVLDIPDYAPLIGWQSGEQEIYQPLGLPKVQQTWKLLRKLSDRLDKMARFLRSHNSTLSEQVRYWTLGAYMGGS
jgi:hypothetical protein